MIRKPKLPPKRVHPEEKSKLHPRNRNRERYDFADLIEVFSELEQFVKTNLYGDESIDFFNPEAVKMLNRALLKRFYNIENWDIPHNYLCPPIPGRADYIHYIADLLGNSNKKNIPISHKIKCLDIGVGANCIYPIIGIKEYDWLFVGSDIDPLSIESVNKIIEMNPALTGNIDIRFQTNSNSIFEGIIQKDEYVDVTICNPPFHASLAEAKAGSARKLNNLRKTKTSKTLLNFGGQNGELFCTGGEEKFIKNMVLESRQHSKSCFWFTTLVSKQSHVKGVIDELIELKVNEFKIIPMGQGNKVSRIVAWTFLNSDERNAWIKRRWK